VKSIDFRGFQAPTGAEPLWKDKKKFKPPPPGKIPEYAPGSLVCAIFANLIRGFWLQIIDEQMKV